MPQVALPALAALARQIAELNAGIIELERAIRAEYTSNPVSRRLATIPSIGPITASAIAAAVPDATLFRSGREFAAWLGLVPRQNGTGGKPRLGPISKKGDRYLRCLLVLGATSMLRRPGGLSPQHRAWLDKLLAKKPARLASVALANKVARIAWAVMAKGTTYRNQEAQTAA